MQLPLACLLALRFVVAGVLLFAAIVKLHAVITGALTAASLAVPLWVMASIAMVEGAIGYFLVRHRSHAFPVFAALVLFSFLLIVAGYRWFSGSVSCDCLGTLALAPSAAVAIDIACIVSLWLIRPSHFLAMLNVEGHALTSKVVTRHGASSALPVSFVGICIPAMLGTDMGRQIVFLPSISRIVASASDTGVGPPGSWGEGELFITNTTGITAAIVGGSGTCGCVVVEQYTAHVPPSGKVSIPFRIIRPKTAGDFREVVTFYLDHPDQYLLHAEIVGRVEIIDFRESQAVVSKDL